MVSTLSNLKNRKKLPSPATLRQDLLASLVVFLVALPLCVGVAVASGVPAELGLVTGIVGGLVVGCLPGSSLQVSGPAAGLTVLVLEAVHEFGAGALGALVLAAGLLQIVLGALHFGRLFRAVSVAVVQGMLAGIGLVLLFGQLYTMAEVRQPRSGVDKIMGIPDLIATVATDADALVPFLVGVGTIAVLVLWRKLPAGARAVPAPLVAVALATAVCALAGLPVATVEVRGIAEAVRPPGADAFDALGSVAALGTVLAFALIASAESLFSAAAVDRMHDGPRTAYDKELMAQGIGNTVCGMLGSLPMTAVIVRSSANVQAGARTKAARVLHGMWLLLFAALLPAAVGVIPLAALAGVLVHAGCKLVPVRQIVPLWRQHRGEAVVLAVTAVAIIATNMFEGVLAGLLLAVVKSAWETSHIQLDVRESADGRLTVTAGGNATFLRLPRMLETLEALPEDRPVELDLSRLRHLDHACRTVLEAWAEQRGATVEMVTKV
ncbi:SulP family inorganic anion transporter [Streptomyces mobaraensis NBRC 13819 = DSM 40847]|uniref:SulP family inorganic anion transporter n=2 Tax=Streptomyces mobaraensis TaxID=35621 RepID=A0A5N5W0V2_STRMB|nr:SulP family inorganic anion transporter [Streptomyces mobaraensis]EME99200.1 transmembrane transport protein [Streptomyces mobaraensis NBRC 13819 = DSM 40847]KAB7835349.1 SulP family inorganic anion transporter [Streptomyces mobaraensis]QTT74212.1 SulP family inorganic anion transporter [Streptomyces mobaraensis NBRC 13819 = DSM 40847]